MQTIINLNKIVNIVLKYKILHAVFWLYSFVTDFHLLQQMRPGPSYHFINYIDAFNEIVFQALSVYFCIYVLVPKFFEKEKYLRFTIGVLLTVIIVTLLELASQSLYVQLLMHRHPPKLVFLAIVFIAKLSNLAIATLIFITIILVQYYYLRDKRNKQIEKEKIISELNFLKSQTNPHFLFNALNSIYVLMMEDINLAKSTLLQFSSLLRYQLYECSSNETSLEKEAAFIKNYIELERIRNGDTVSVSFEHQKQMPYFPIAPFILIPFVENAFKHLSRFNGGKNQVTISLSVENSIMSFNVKNSCDAEYSENGIQGGIGLQNVTRRLELLYPGNHFLQIKKEKSFFFVTLIIEINAN